MRGGSGPRIREKLLPKDVDLWDVKAGVDRLWSKFDGFKGPDSSYLLAGLEEQADAQIVQFPRDQHWRVAAQASAQFHNAGFPKEQLCLEPGLQAYALLMPEFRLVDLLEDVFDMHAFVKKGELFRPWDKLFTPDDLPKLVESMDAIVCNVAEIGREYRTGKTDGADSAIDIPCLPESAYRR